MLIRDRVLRAFRVLSASSFILHLGFSSTSAYCADGRIEISQTCAVISGCLATDAPGFPVTISESGSYVFTSNLQVEAPFTSAIQISAEDVSLDLNGYAIAALAPFDAGTAIVASANRVSVRNGLIESFRSGVWLLDQSRVDDLRINDFGGFGIIVGRKGLVTDCFVQDVGLNAIAILAGDLSVVRRNTTLADGIGGDGTLFDQNLVFTSIGGLDATGSSFLTRNSVQSELPAAILSLDSGFWANVLFGRADPSIVVRGIDAGGNLVIDPDD